VHTREHFLREEALMREARFPTYAAHKAEHDRVLAQMDAEARLFRAHGDSARLSRYILDALPEWYVAHTRTMDVSAARFVAEKGA
jgi:hemerythrin